MAGTGPASPSSPAIGARIADIERAMQDAYSTSGGLGLGVARRTPPDGRVHDHSPSARARRFRHEMVSTLDGAASNGQQPGWSRPVTRLGDQCCVRTIDQRIDDRRL
jgi:hypothetical protein